MPRSDVRTAGAPSGAVHEDSQALYGEVAEQMSRRALHETLDLGEGLVQPRSDQSDESWVLQKGVAVESGHRALHPSGPQRPVGELIAVVKARDVDLLCRQTARCSCARLPSRQHDLLE